MMENFKYCTDDLIFFGEAHETPVTATSKFDKRLQEMWESAMKLGYFKYELNEVEYRNIPGSKNYVAQLNSKRFSERRKPEKITKVSQPFNQNQFNFSKIHDREILFELVRSRQTEHHETVDSPPTDIIQRSLVNGDVTMTCDESLSNENRDHMTSVIINVSPFEHCHILLAPERLSCQPQVLSVDAVQVAVEAVLLSSRYGFRVAYNSMGGLASVNHLHMHAYYLTHKLTLDDCKVEPFTEGCYELCDWPVPAYVFQLHQSDITYLCRRLARVTDYLIANEIAHNLFVTRGTTLETDSQRSTVRVYLWPRKCHFGPIGVNLFNVAAAELAGHFPCKDSEGFHNLTQEEIDAELSTARLDDDLYEKVKRDIKSLLVDTVP